MDNSISDMFSTSDIFETSNNMTINNEFESLRIIFEEVLCTVSFVDVEEIVFKEEIPKLKQACNEALNQILAHLKNIKNESEFLQEIKQLIQRYINLLNFAHTAIKYISNRVTFSQVQSLPLAVSEILLQVFKHCKESDNLYGTHFVSVSYLLTDLFKKANELQSSFLALLNNILIFDLCEEDQIVFLVQVTEILAAIGEIVSGLDIKTTAELWKAYLVLLQKNNVFLKTRINIEPSLKYFCTEIMNSLDSIGTMSDMKHIEKSLKISTFNLKILIKLCSLYDVCGESTQKIFILLITLNKFSIPYLQFQKRNPKFIDLMQIYVTVASEPLLNCLINNREFIQHYFKNINLIFKDDDKRLAGIFLTVAVIKKCLISELETRKQWISEDSSHNIIFTVFSSLDNFHAEFSVDYPIQIQGSNGEPTRISTLYEYVLVHLISIIITVNSKQFKIIQNLLFVSIMQPHFWKAKISSDIWIAIGRFGSAEFCYDSLKFLINIYIKLQNYNRPEIKFISSVIRRNYCLLSVKYKTELISQYPINQYIKLWTIIEIKNDSILTSKLQNFVDEASKNINTFLGNKSEESFISTCEILELLTTQTFSDSNEKQVTNLANQVTKLWSLNIDSQIQDQLWIFKFIRSRSKITSGLIKHFSNEELLKILQSMKDINNDNLKLSNCFILKSLASKQIPFTREQQDIFDIISSLFNSLLKDNNPIIKQRALETFQHFAYHTTHEEVLANVVEDDSKLQEEVTNYLQKITQEINQPRIDYFRTQSKVCFQHKCYENFRSSEPLQKKKKLDSDVNISGMIQTIKYNCDNLIEYYKNETISDEVSTEINAISSKLQLLLNK